MKLLDWILRRNALVAPAPAPAARREPGLKISLEALGLSNIAPAEPAPAPKGEFKRPDVAPFVIPADKQKALLAMDEAMSPVYAYVSEAYAGMGFLGYPYLAELSQRPEYRKMSDVIAKEMTRKWIKLEVKGDDDKGDKLEIIEKAMRKHRLRAKFRLAALQDGLFGRSQIYIDVKTPSGTLAWADTDELQSILVKSPAKIAKGSLVGFKVIDPVWTTPYLYNSDNPMRADFYKPTSWFVLGRQVHSSRLLNIVSREVPDLLKPSYNFGGMSLTQLTVPYVNNWLKTRQAVANLIDGFSVGVFKTNLQSILQGDPGDDVFARIDVFNRTRTNRGVFAVNKEDEEFGFENVPLSGLDALQNQSLEQLCVVPGIPLVKYTGITPSGLNATAEGEIRVFYDEMHSAQEAVFRDPLQQCLEVIQLDEFGEIDPDITFSFVPLWQMSEKELADVRKLDADTDAVLVDIGAVSPQEVRERVAADETNGYHSLDISDDDGDGLPDAVPGAPPPLEDDVAQDSTFREEDHPRDEGGKFGAGGGGSASPAVKLKGDELGDATSGKELRQKALDYAGRFIGQKFTNEATGNDIQVTKTGVKHTISGSGPDLLRTVPAIPDLIHSAKLVGSESDKTDDPNIKAVETYSAGLEMRGKRYEVVMTVKQYNDGRRYYDHGFMKGE